MTLFQADRVIPNRLNLIQGHPMPYGFLCRIRKTKHLCKYHQQLPVPYRKKSQNILIANALVGQQPATEIPWLFSSVLGLQ